MKFLILCLFVAAAFADDWDDHWDDDDDVRPYWASNSPTFRSARNFFYRSDDDDDDDDDDFVYRAPVSAVAAPAATVYSANPSPTVYSYRYDDDDDDRFDFDDDDHQFRWSAQPAVVNPKPVVYSYVSNPVVPSYVAPRAAAQKSLRVQTYSVPATFSAPATTYSAPRTTFSYRAPTVYSVPTFYSGHYVKPVTTRAVSYSVPRFYRSFDHDDDDDDRFDWD